MSTEEPDNTFMTSPEDDSSESQPTKADTNLQSDVRIRSDAPEPKSGRRTFINVLIGGGLIGWLGTIIYPVLAYLRPPSVPEVNVNSIKAGVVSDFELSSAKIVQFGRRPVILVRMKNGDFRALSATCTHLDCIVQYRQDLDHIWCACHNGHYDLNGRNISGPPPAPLATYTVNIVDEEIVITKSEQIA